MVATSSLKLVRHLMVFHVRCLSGVVVRLRLEGGLYTWRSRGAAKEETRMHLNQWLLGPEGIFSSCLQQGPLVTSFCWNRFTWSMHWSTKVILRRDCERRTAKQICCRPRRNSHRSSTSVGSHFCIRCIFKSWVFWWRVSLLLCS